MPGPGHGWLRAEAWTGFRVLTRDSLELAGVAHGERFAHGLLDFIDTHPQLAADLFVGQAVELREQENFSHGRRHAVEQFIDLYQGFNQQGFVFRGHLQCLWLLGQRLQVSALHRLTAPAIDQQAIGNRRQIGQGLAQVIDRAPRPHDAYKRILRQVIGIGVFLQAFTQPVLQPTTVLQVEVLDILFETAVVGHDDENQLVIDKYSQL